MAVDLSRPMETPRLHPDTIEDVKQRLNIVEIISEYVVLRKQGRGLTGLCPFHQEKTPSFNVDPEKQLYHCFGCGVGGNSFNFLMEMNKTSFAEVVLELAQRYQVPLRTLEPEQRQEIQRQISLKEQLYEIMAVASKFYQHTLHQPQGENALQYLKASRHLKDETIQRFELGYAPSGWEVLYRYLVELKRYPLPMVAEAGLIKKRNSGEGFYDQFRDRLIIPIHDRQGRVIAFGSRTLTNEEPKYLNSPETPLFNKSKTLFALDKAYKAIAKEDQAIVVEGYFDAIALHAVGITNTVACLGTALTLPHIKLLSSYTDSKQIVLNFDGDAAGNKATTRVVNEIEAYIYSGQIQLKVLNLPNGKDADEFLSLHKENPAEIYRDLLKVAPLWLDWQIQQVLLNRDLKQPSEFPKIAQELVKLLNKINSADLVTHYVGEVAEILGQGNGELIQMYTQKLKVELKKPQFKPEVKRNKTEKIELHLGEEETVIQAETQLLLIYLHSTYHRLELWEEIENRSLVFSISEYRGLWQEIIKLQEEKPELLTETSNQLLSLLQDHYASLPEERAKLSKVFMLNQIGDYQLSRCHLLINTAIATLELLKNKKYQRYCRERWLALDPIIQLEQREYYRREFLQAQQEIKELEKQRSVGIEQVL